ncbi:MAG: AraC family transcriptional regulator [Paenibacillaceae bacterium]|jgi:AraC-like DNA-binding protein|nr:AraC family transcriptional regulator [Paenibacillaceae bacterium]
MHELTSSRFMKEDFPFFIHQVSHGTKNTPALHRHDFVELVYVVRGQGSHVFEQEKYPIRAGDVFIINPGETHTYSFQEGERIEIINCLFLPGLIHDSLLRELEISQSMDYFYVHPFLDRSERFNHRLNLREEDAERVHLLLANMIKDSADPQSTGHILIRLQLIELLLLLSTYYKAMRQRKRTSESSLSNQSMMARRIQGYMERNFDQKITLPSLAEIFNISVRQLSRVMRQSFGQSVIEMLHDIRIRRAKQLLADSDVTIAEVAGLIGYEDPVFFNRLFTRKVGSPPGKFRMHAVGELGSGSGSSEMESHSDKEQN